MKCPICNNDMKSGFVRPTGRGGICWTNGNDEWSAPRSDEGFFEIGKIPWLKGNCIPAEHCPSCKKILIDYSTLE